MLWQLYHSLLVIQVPELPLWGWSRVGWERAAFLWKQGLTSEGWEGGCQPGLQTCRHTGNAGWVLVKSPGVPDSSEPFTRMAGKICQSRAHRSADLPAQKVLERIWLGARWFGV